ncbi:hypothetical protein [Haloarcula sp. H-GB5]
MSKPQNHSTADSKFSSYDFYLPAVALPPNFSRIEAAVSDLFDFHGVVLIPESYNK